MLHYYFIAVECSNDRDINARAFVKIGLAVFVVYKILLITRASVKKF
jgi:hypothetical protein